MGILTKLWLRIFYPYSAKCRARSAPVIRIPERRWSISDEVWEKSRTWSGKYNDI